MIIAVTGGMGFIGTKVISSIYPNHDVICVDDWRRLLADYEKMGLPVRDRVYANLARCSHVCEPEEFLSRFKSLGPHVVIHLGAVVNTLDMGGTGDLWYKNVDYTQLLCDVASSAGSHMVFASSAAVYGRSKLDPHPINPYGLSKMIGEKMVCNMKTRTRCLRFFNVFGEDEHHKGAMASMPWKITQAYRKGGVIDVHSPDAARDFISVDAVASVVVETASSLMSPLHLKHQTLDVGTGESTTFRDIDNFVMQAVGQHTSRVRWVDQPPELVGRYQSHTCAGVGAPLAPSCGAKTTREMLMGCYAKQG